MWGGERAGGLYWKLIGRGTGYEHKQPFIESDGTEAVTDVVVLDDTLAMTTAGGESCFEWVLSPFIDPTIQSKKDLFLSELALARGMPVSDLKSWLGDTANIADLLLNGVPDLTAAYEAVANDFNLTSLCLYSGPKANEGSTEGVYLARLGSYFHGPTLRRDIGWLATGDAALRAKIRAAAFTKHYGSHMENTGTLTVPHHGSDHNHNPELVNKSTHSFISPLPTLIPSGSIQEQGDAMCASWSLPFGVTSNSESEVEEIISVSCLANRNP